MGVLKRWNGTEWETIGAPSVEHTDSYFAIDEDGILSLQMTKDENNSQNSEN